MVPAGLADAAVSSRDPAAGRRALAKVGARELRHANAQQNNNATTAGDNRQNWNDADNFKAVFTENVQIAERIEKRIHARLLA